MFDADTDVDVDDFDDVGIDMETDTGTRSEIGANPGGLADTGIVAISRRGAALARTLAGSLAGENTLYLERRLLDSDDYRPVGTDESSSRISSTSIQVFDLPLRPVLQRLFEQHRRLTLFMPVGAAVRLLAPSLQHKHNDPAVVCVDDAGRFAVSLLSGHVGGADSLTEEVAGILGALPVITSASHVIDTLAVDMLGREFGWRIEADPVTVTRVSAAVVNGEPVGLYQEAGEPNWWPPGKPLPNNVTVYSSLEALAQVPGAAALLITDRELTGPTPANRESTAGRTVSAVPGETLVSEIAADLVKNRLVALYRPRSLVVGMGCRRGVPLDELEQLLVGVFRRHNLSLSSLACIATAEIKRGELGIQQLAEKYGVPMYCYQAEELNRLFPPLPQTEVTEEAAGAAPAGSGPTPSAVAHRLLGVWGVSEPAALLASGSRELLVTREKTNRATVAVARMGYSRS